jgi:hypothetical protein
LMDLVLVIEMEAAIFRKTVTLPLHEEEEMPVLCKRTTYKSV